MDKQPYSVIVAEDEELLLNNLIQKIHSTNLNFMVTAKAQTGSQALELVKQFNPDVLITDIKMPVMTGIELIEQVHQQYPSVRTVIISGFSDFEYAKKAITYRVEAYLLKPIDTDELSEALLKIKTQLELEQAAYNNIFNETMSSNTPQQIAQILKDYIVHNYHEDINLNSIAQNLNYSPSYLTKIFSQYYDTTPNKYIISLRIQQAQHLLVHNPELSIKQIGEIIGYPDQGYFSRIFKKQTNLSPYDYREKRNLGQITLP